MRGLFSWGKKWWRRRLPLAQLSRPASIREWLADVIFIGLRLLARYGFIIGALVGGYFFSTPGFFLGLLIGILVGYWIRFSLAVRKGDLTNAFFVRMHERSLGRKPRTLESFLETIRGNRLTLNRCHTLATIYNEMRHHLQTCFEDDERRRVLKKFESDFLLAMYGLRSFPETPLKSES